MQIVAIEDVGFETSDGDYVPGEMCHEVDPAETVGSLVDRLLHRHVIAGDFPLVKPKEE